MPFEFSSFRIADLVEILLLTAAIYAVLRFIRSTRGVGVLRGLVAFVVGIGVLIGVLDYLVPGGLDVIKFLLSIVTPFFAVVVVVLFQEELRQGIGRVGRAGFFRFTSNTAESPTELHKVVTSAKRLANQRIGALIAFQREMSLKPFSEGAVSMNLPITSILLETIFFPGSPLHDGGVVIRGKNIVAASCIFPLTSNPEVARRLGTRHRAALGLTERTDAVVLIVSEETGELSLAADGVLYKPVKQERLEAKLQELLKTESRVKREEESGEEPASASAPPAAEEARA